MVISWWIIFCACIDYIVDVNPDLKLIWRNIQVTGKKNYHNLILNFKNLKLKSNCFTQFLFFFKKSQVYIQVLIRSMN
jgi:hypothetical protein